MSKNWYKREDKGVQLSESFFWFLHASFIFSAIGFLSAEIYVKDAIPALEPLVLSIGFFFTVLGMGFFRFSWSRWEDRRYSYRLIWTLLAVSSISSVLTFFLSQA